MKPRNDAAAGFIMLFQCDFFLAVLTLQARIRPVIFEQTSFRVQRNETTFYAYSASKRKYIHFDEQSYQD
jgi:hypothetical protein